MITQFQIFGIKTVYLNGFAVHTLKVRIKHNPFNLDFVLKHSKGLSTHFATNYIELSFTTMDKQLFELAAKTTGFILKSIAQENHNKKYNWTLNL